MLFGPLLHTLPQFILSGKTLKFRDVIRYVGVVFQSTHRNIFASHYTEKHDCAAGTACAITSCDLLVGNRRMPPSITKQLYTILVDCHLTNGCKIMPDRDPSLLHILEDIQLRFLHRMLGLSTNSVITLLYTETGIMPIRTRRVSLTLRYLKYLIRLPNNHYASLALAENDNLRNLLHPCWLSDLDYAINQLPHLHALNGALIDQLIKAIEFSTKTNLQSHIDTWSKLSLLRHCLEPKEEGPAKPQMIGLRHYLTQIPKHSHRRTITKLLCGDFTPQVFHASPSPLRQLTATENLNRLCHACTRHPETPQHILFQCPSLSSICSLHADFITYTHQHQPVPFNAFFSDPTVLHYLKSFIFDWALITPTAKFVHNVIDRWRSFLDTGIDSEDVAESGSDDSDVE
ncbi:hypothetical protein EV368DRAFT_85945 [Lentinula lateritia]|nr:hypothetical protein EV368DRAFT_85945 [Lentinula lateritia]